MRNIEGVSITLLGAPEFILRDKDGNIKKLWNENKFGKFIRTFFGFDLQGVSFLGVWKDSLAIKNLITSAGKAGIASRINGSGAEATFTYLALGTGATAANVADTTLQTEITDSGLARAAATASRVTTSVANDTAQLSVTWTVSGTKAITEIGAFNAASSGVLLGRQVFAAINAVASDTLTMNYKFQVS